MSDGKRTPKKAAREIELDPDAWPRFEQFIKDVAKAGPQHRPAPNPKQRPASKGRVRKGKSRA
jgi:hypothetical protein